jgi:hypothetical protein
MDLREAGAAVTAHTSHHSPAKAGDPVFRDVSDRTARPQRTGSPAFAEDDTPPSIREFSNENHFHNDSNDPAFKPGNGNG